MAAVWKKVVIESSSGTIAQATTGNAATVSTIAGLAPNTATTQATQGAITSAANLATVGTITTGVWSGTALVAGKVPAITGLTGYTAGAYANASSTGGSSIVTVGTIASGTWEGTAVASAYIADNAVTLAKMAGGTDGNLISFDTSGDPAYVATGTSGHILTSNGSGAAPTFQAAGSAATRDSLGLDTDDSPQFAGINLGAASDTTLTRSAAGKVAIEGATIRTGTVPLTFGGTGATSASAARTALGVDAAGTDNSTAVTLANTNYLSISGQAITGGTVPTGSGGTGSTSSTYCSLTANVSGTLPAANGGTGATSITALKNLLDGETWTFAENVTLSGDLIVNGSTISTSSEIVKISNNTLVLNDDLTSATDVDAGIIIERGDVDNYAFYWDEGRDMFRVGTTAANKDLTTALTYLGDVMLCRNDGGAIDDDEDILNVGNSFQYYDSQLYFRVEDS